MTARTLFSCIVVISLASLAAAQPALRFPSKVEAGTAFSVSTAGSGDATLYIVGPADALARKVHLGENVT
ncbi:MAG: hypothetical protein WBL82_16575, partial [Terriglobales bacterium]